MTTVLLEQKVRPENGQLVVELTADTLPNGFDFTMAFSHNADILKFKAIKVPGTSSTYTSSSSDGTTAHVTITGYLQPSSDQFASLIFEGVGSGTFQMNISELSIAGAAAEFTNPPPTMFDLPEVPVDPDPDPSPDPDPQPDPDPDPTPQPIIDPVEFLTGVYVAAFDRAPEFEGHQYWIEELQNKLDQGMSAPDAFKLLAHQMYAAGAEHGEHGTDLPNPDYVEYLYQTVLGREGDADGLEYWTKALNDGVLPRSEFIAVFLSAALEPGNEDGNYVRARIEVAQHFAAEVFSGPAAIESGFTESLGNVLDGVHDTATAEAAIAKMNEALEGDGLSASSASYADDWVFMEDTFSAQDPYDAGATPADSAPQLLALGVEVNDDDALL